MSIRLSQAIDGFLLEKELAGASPNTIGDYQRNLAKFQRWLEKSQNLPDPPIASIRKSHIQAFLQHLLTTRFDGLSGVAPRTPKPYAPHTIKNIHTTLSSLWSWAQKEGYVRTNIVREIPAPKQSEIAIEPFTQQEIRKLLRAAEQSETWRDSEKVSKLHNATRNKAIILLLLDTGIRASELCNLSLDDIDLKMGTAKVRGKGRMDHGRGKERIVYFSKATSKAIWRYLSERPETTFENVFLTQDGNPIARDRLYTMLKRIGKRAGVNGVHPHRFRHTFAISFLRNGGDVYSLQRLLGHTSLDMVKRYLKIAESDAASAHRRASPVENWRL